MREMTGTSEFNDVFFTDVRVPAENLVGGPVDRVRTRLGSKEHRFPVPLPEFPVRVGREFLSSRLDLHWNLC